MSTIKAIDAGRNAFAELATKRGQKLTNIPLKDNSIAKILSNENSFDVYFVKKRWQTPKRSNVFRQSWKNPSNRKRFLGKSPKDGCRRNWRYERMVKKPSTTKNTNKIKFFKKADWKICFFVIIIISIGM